MVRDLTSTVRRTTMDKIVELGLVSEETKGFSGPGEGGSKQG